MTIPIEKRRAFYRMKEFVRSLLDPKATPRVPKSIRKEAYWALRHYLYDFEMEQIVKAHPKLFGKLDEEPHPKTTNAVEERQRRAAAAAALTKDHK